MGPYLPRRGCLSAATPGIIADIYDPCKSDAAAVWFVTAAPMCYNVVIQLVSILHRCHNLHLERSNRQRYLCKIWFAAT